MISDVTLRENPALLKLDLYCKGARLDDSCFIEADGGRKILRTRAGLGSGLELILPRGLWTNVPVTEPFAAQSPYVVHREKGGYFLRYAGRDVTDVKLSPRPGWYDAETSSGKPMTRIGTLQGYLGIYQAKVSEYWTAKPQKTNCKFCSVGLNLGVDDSDEKSVKEVMEVVRLTRGQSGITYVDFNTGHYEGDTYLDILEPYLVRIKKEPRHEPWVVNGEIIAGLEPPESSIKAIDWITSVGATPTVCVFRPLVGTDLEKEAAPKTEDMIPIFRRLYEACMEKGLPIGCAPNVHVSLVMLPEECRRLSPRRFPLKTLKLKTMAAAFGYQFGRRAQAARA